MQLSNGNLQYVSYGSGSWSVVPGPLEVLETLSQSPQGQNYFHNDIVFFTVGTFASDGAEAVVGETAGTLA